MNLFKKYIYIIFLNINFIYSNEIKNNNNKINKNFNNYLIIKGGIGIFDIIKYPKYFFKFNNFNLSEYKFIIERIKLFLSYELKKNNVIYNLNIGFSIGNINYFNLITAIFLFKIYPLGFYFNINKHLYIGFKIGYNIFFNFNNKLFNKFYFNFFKTLLINITIFRLNKDNLIFELSKNINLNKIKNLNLENIIFNGFEFTIGYLFKINKK